MLAAGRAPAARGIRHSGGASGGLSSFCHPPAPRATTMPNKASRMRTRAPRRARWGGRCWGGPRALAACSSRGAPLRVGVEGARRRTAWTSRLPLSLRRAWYTAAEATATRTAEGAAKPRLHSQPMSRATHATPARTTSSPRVVPHDDLARKRESSRRYEGQPTSTDYSSLH